MNIGLAHIEGFGSVDRIVQAKSEIFQGLVKNGTVILNQDDQAFEKLKALSPTKNIITFGTQKNCVVCAQNIKLDAAAKPSFDLIIAKQTVQIQLPLIGEHNVMNALAACALATTIDIDIETMKRGLEQCALVKKRLYPYKGLRGSLIIDDTYNAIPQAVMNALHLLASKPGKKIFVFGGMAELGEISEKMHCAIGQLARDLQIDHLLAVGPMSHLTTQTFGHGEHFTNKELLIARLKNYLDSNSTVLIKGSRSSCMEEVVEAIKSE